MILKSQNLTRYLIYLILFLLPFYIFRFKIGPFRTNIFEISIFITFVVFIVQQIISGRFKKIRFGGVAPLIFIVIALISVIQSDSLITGLGIFKGWFLAPFLLYLMIINLFDKDSLPKLSIPLFCSLIVVSFWAVLQRAGIIGTLFYQFGDPSFAQYLFAGRYFGPFESPNFLAMFITPMFFLSILLLPKIKNIIVKILAGILFILPIYALYLTGSRGGLFAFCVSAVVFLGLAFLPAIKKYASALSVAKVIGLVAVNVVYFYFFLQIKFPSGAASDKVRQEIYDYAVKLLKSDWLLGIGLGSFQKNVQTLSTTDYSFINFGLPYALHPHNLLLAIWLNLGLAGLIAFLFIIGNFLKQIIVSSPSIIRASVGAAMTAVLVHGLFDTTYFKNDLSAIFWLLMAFAAVSLTKGAYEGKIS